jgi:excisionase family DNA binding protein
VTDTRLTLRQAAAVLGVSESAVRKRVERGTLRSYKGPDGRRYVYLDGADTVTDTLADEGADVSATHERDALISEMQERLAFLERELDVRSEEIRRRDTIIMNMTEAMKSLTPHSQQEPVEAREPPESPSPTETPSQAPAETKTGVQRPQAAAQSLWRRIFGG